MATRPAMVADAHADYQENACTGLGNSSQTLPSEALTKAGFQVGVLEFIPALQQPVWQHPLAIENQSTGHFTEHDFEDKSGEGCKGGTPEHPPQGFGVLFLCDRFGSREVVGPLTRFGHHQVIGGVDLVVK